MSKSVRLRDHLVAEVERLASEERRSLANMVEILLEQALKLEVAPITKETVKTEPVYVQTETTTTPREERRAAETANLKRSYEHFSLVCKNRDNHEPGVYCPECKGDGGR